MGKIIAKIVLTGGPCSGKTNSLCRIEEHFEELGYKVIIVPEAATLMINGGIRPFGNMNLSPYEFQNSIIKLQMQNELLFEKLAEKYPEDTQCILLYDRGIIDGNAYINNEDFEKLLKDNNLNKNQIFNHYDMVIHLVTAANGAIDFYTLDNNTARKETPLEAINIDYKTMKVWSKHQNFNIIDNKTDFQTKIDRVINIISYNLGIGLYVRKQEKYLVDISKLNYDFFENASKVIIEQSYIGNQDYEKRLRKKIINNTTYYYFTIQKYDRYGTSKIYTNKRITEKEYYEILNNETEIKKVNKIRYLFISDNEQYRLDIYEDGKCILEANEDSKLYLPDGIEILEEITNKMEYYNYYIAQKQKKLLPSRII